MKRSDSKLSLDPHEHLRTVDPKLRAVIERVGPCPLALPVEESDSRAHCFEALVRAIVSQQLSTKAAASIFSRVEALGGASFPPPAQLASMPVAQLRSVGLSEMKVRAVHDLCARVLDESLPIESLHELEDEAVIEHLVAVRGIGRWTAEMFLMFRLHRPDVLSTADLGLRKGMMHLYGLSELPSPDVMQERAARWRPFRTVACWYLWRVAETLKPEAKSPKRAESASASKAKRA